MRKYELMCLLNPEKDTVEDHLKFVEDTLSQNNIKIVETKDVGQRKLAYPIDEITNGRYYLYQLEMEPASIPEMEKAFKLYKGVMRHIMLQVQ